MAKREARRFENGAQAVRSHNEGGLALREAGRCFGLCLSWLRAGQTEEQRAFVLHAKRVMRMRHVALSVCLDGKGRERPAPR